MSRLSMWLLLWWTESSPRLPAPEATGGQGRRQAPRRGCLDGRRNRREGGRRLFVSRSQGRIGRPSGTGPATPSCARLRRVLDAFDNEINRLWEGHQLADWNAT